MFEIEAYPDTIVEILRILYFSGGIQASGDLQNALRKRSIELELRTIRYHLANLEKDGIVRRFGNKGVVLTERGVEEARMLLVFDRIGVSSAEIERIAADSDYDPAADTGKVLVNTLLIGENRLDDVLGVLAATSASPVIISSRVGLVRSGERLWNFVVPQGHVALLGITARNFDVFLQKRRIPTETIATVLLRIEDNEPKGIADILFHSGTTLSPGELLIRGRYTSVSDVVRTGNGLATASIKTFPPQFFDEVAEMLHSLDRTAFSGLIEMKGQLPPAYRMSYRDREKGYMLVYGGANFFAPLVEQHLAENLRISHALYDISRMRPVAELLRPNAGRRGRRAKGAPGGFSAALSGGLFSRGGLASDFQKRVVGVEKRGQPVQNAVAGGVAGDAAHPREGAFPDDGDAPFFPDQACVIDFVPFPVPFQLRRPPLAPGFGERPVGARVVMPEAAVNEDDGAEFRQDEVRRSRQILPVKAETIPLPEEEGADDFFGLRVLRTDTTHVPAAQLFREPVHVRYTARSSGRSLMSFSRLPRIMLSISSTESSEAIFTTARWSSGRAKW